MIWDKAANDTLTHYWHSPLPIDQIILLFPGSTYDSIRFQAYRLKLGRKKAPKRIWDPQRCARLRYLWPRERTAADVAKLMGLTEGSVYAQATAMRLPFRTRTGPRRGAKPTKWTKSETAKLLELHSSGLSASQCGRKLGRTRNSVIGRLSRIMLGCDRLDSNYVPRAAG